MALKKRTCIRCHREYRPTNPSQRYCSQRCWYDSRLRNLSAHTCERCGEAYSPIRESQRFCSISCHQRYRHALRRGTAEPEYKPYLQTKSEGKTKPVHRVVMEQHLGRKLLPTEIVHHKEKGRFCNEIDNLHLYNSQTEHMREHASSYRSNTEKECLTCRQTKPLGQFYSYIHKTNGRRYYESHCKPCHNRLVDARRKRKKSG